MKLYRLAFYDVQRGQQGYAFVATKREANTRRRAFMARYPTRAMRREWLPRVDVGAIDIEPTREGILDALNRYASHPPDNGRFGA